MQQQRFATLTLLESGHHLNPARVVAQTCICADGGANRLYDAAPSFVPHLSPVEARRHIKPTAIAGDLDSITKEVRRFYNDEGTRIIDLSHDQDSTDFQKCLCELEKQFDAEQLIQYTIIAAGQCHCSCMLSGF